jgi:tetratricopeptide (TPR) repeat protein
LARALDDKITDAIVSRADGNPFFLEELAQSTLQRGGDLDRDVPKTVQEVLAARIDRLGEASKYAIQTAAVLGRDFSAALLSAVIGDDAGTEQQLEELKRLEFVYERNAAAPGSHSFKHALTQEVAYASLLERHRRELHRRAGRSLEKLHAGQLDEQYELLAHHYAKSDDREKAADYLILANRKAAARNAMQEAIDYFYEALRVLEALPDSDENRRRRLRLVFDQTGEFHFLHRHQEYYDLILKHQALALEVDDIELLGAFYARLGHRQWTSNRITDSVETLEHAAELCERCGNVHDAAAAYAILAWAHVMLGNYQNVPYYRDKALEKVRQNFHPVWYSFARAAASLGYIFTGRWDDAIREADLAVAEGRSRSDHAIVSFNTAWIAVAQIFKRDWKNALASADVSLREAPSVYFRGFPQSFIARILCETGDASTGIGMLAQIEPLFEASGHRPAWCLVALFRAEVCLSVGDIEQALPILDKLHAACAAGLCKFWLGQTSRMLGDIALGRGAYEEATTRLEQAIEVARTTGAENELGLALASYGRLRRDVGNTPSARAYLTEALEILDRLGTLEVTAAVRNDLEHLPADRSLGPAVSSPGVVG